MPSALALLALLSALANTVGQLCGVGGRPFLQILFQAVFVDSLRTSTEVIATALLVNTIAFSLGVPGYGSLGLYDSRLILDIATVSVPAAILGASAGAFFTDKVLRLVYAVLVACAAAALAARAQRLVPQTQPKANTESAPLIASSPLSDSTAVQLPSEVFSREGNFLFIDDVERLSLLDDSDSEYGDVPEIDLPELDIENQFLHREQFADMLGRGRSLFFNSVNTLLLYASSARSMLSPTANTILPNTVTAGNDVRKERRQTIYPLTQVLQSSMTSLTSLSCTAKSLISMSASATGAALLPTSAQAASPPPSQYGALPTINHSSWPLLDLALARYDRPALSPRDKCVLLVGGLLCGALGVGVPESVLIVLVGLQNIPLAVAATSAISVAFYAQMVASMMDAVASAADAAEPRIAESVPWGLVAALVPGVVVGALVGPRLHAFIPERRMLVVASAALSVVSVAVAVVGSTR